MDHFSEAAFRPKLTDEENTTPIGGLTLEEPVLAQVYPNRAKKYGYSVLIVYKPSKNNVWQNRKSIRALYARGFYQ